MEDMLSTVGQLRFSTRAILFFFFLLLALSSATQIAAQDNGGQDSTNNTSAQQNQYSSPPELTADQIIAILQANPDVAQNLKMAAAQNGLTGTREQAIQRLQTDESVRIQVTQYLIEQGVVDPSDPRLHANDQSQSGQNGQYGGGQNQGQGTQNNPAYRQPYGQQQNGQQPYGQPYGPQQQPYGQQVPYGQQQPYGQPPYNNYPPQQGGYNNAQGNMQGGFPQYGPGTAPNGNMNNGGLPPGTNGPAGQAQSGSEIPILRQRIPPAYRNIPALKDLYSQVSDFNLRLTRFGVDMLRSNSALTITTDVSAGPDYILGPGDDLELTLWGGVSRQMRLTIDREGRISLPEIGTVLLAGKSLGDARVTVQTSLGSQYRNIHSDLALARVRTVRVYVVGDVARPGAYDISALSTILNAIAAAGGPTERGSLRRIRQYRGSELVAEADMYDLLLKGVRGKIAGLAPGDTILVPTVGPQVTVTGMVRRPAIYELKDETDLAQVLDLAGGVLATGSLREVRIERVQAHEGKTMLSLKLPDLKDTAGVKIALAGFKAQDGDRVIIGAIAPYSNQAVYLDGHVIHPGKYSFHQGMDVSELIRSYQDLLPEPSDHAEIIRLKPPDLRPEVIDFNLREVLTGEDPVVLQPFDTIRIYGRYDVDAPLVAIYGEVARPGEYPMSDGMTAADLVRMAGGLKRSAYRQTADLASYTISQNKKVEVESRTVEIGKALQGVEDTDVRLKPRDVLTIRQLAGWNTVGTVVKVSGEVNYPGTYGIVEGERLSSVLQRAGGFREDAYPRGAVLSREDVRKLNEKARDTLIDRVQSMIPDVKDPTAAMGVVSAAQNQQEQMIRRLKATAPSGRQVIKISANISSWANTPADIELRPGDEIVIPKYPTFVTVQGQVNSPSAITYVPGKNAEWYFRRAGGHTPAASMKDLFVIRADGTVLGRGSSSGFWSGKVTNTVMYPGDTVVVPEKIITGSSAWRTLLQTVQVMSSVAVTAGVLSNF
jgi:protein involved in polysaccharide export with SLBB domain